MASTQRIQIPIRTPNVNYFVHDDRRRKNRSHTHRAFNTRHHIIVEIRLEKRLAIRSSVRLRVSWPKLFRCVGFKVERIFRSARSTATNVPWVEPRTARFLQSPGTNKDTNGSVLPNAGPRPTPHQGHKPSLNPKLRNTLFRHGPRRRHDPRTLAGTPISSGSALVQCIKMKTRGIQNRRRSPLPLPTIESLPGYVCPDLHRSRTAISPARSTHRWRRNCVPTPDEYGPVR